MEEKIAQLTKEAAELIKNKAQTLPELNDIRVRFLGKKGEITGMLKSLGQLAPEERPKFGQVVNQARAQLEEMIAARTAELKTEELKQKLAGKEKKDEHEK